VENGPERLAYSVIKNIKPQVSWPIIYATEERQGISYARNKLVALSKECNFIAFIDDDETAEPQWLEELLLVQHTTGADAVIGPVIPEFEKPPPDWMAPFFYRPRHSTGKQVSCYNFRTGNLLLSTKSIKDFKEPFDLAFALTGGEDSYLGRCLTKKGACFYWADKAVVHEYIPKNRIKISWFLLRNFRGGITSAMIDMRQHTLLGGWIIRFFKGVACIPYGALVAIFSLKPGRKALLGGVCFISWGVGSLLGLLGVRYKEYKNIHGKYTQRHN
jgi:glycosyltransferase involved in cell wall biosynthesis